MSRRYFTPGVLIGHLVVLIAVLVCLRLGWWQWEVSQRPRGTVQNLGYALLWPVFAGSFIYMWLRFLQLEGGRDVVDGRDADGRDAGGAVRDDRATAGGDPAETPIRIDEAAAGIDDGTRHRSTGRSAPTPPTTPGSRPRGDSYTVGVGYIGEAEDDELAAYNRALAALAEQDEGRAH